MIATFKSIFDLLKAFPDEQTCINHLEQLRWAGNVVSPFDSTSKVYKCKGNKYRCKNTGKYFNVRTETIFEDTKLPLQKWFMALYIFSSHKKGISSHQLAKDLDITQKTAWFVLHRLRYAFDHPAFKAIVGDSGPTQADETFMGGKEKNKHNGPREGRTPTKSLITTGISKYLQDSKTPVIGILGANGIVIAKKVENIQAKTLLPILQKHIAPGSTIVTDEHKGYTKLPSLGFTHKTVIHSKHVYSFNGYHTNGIENFWSQLKRGVYGIYHQVSPEHLQAYVDEFTLRFNTRTYTTANRFDLILSNVAGKRLTYANLIQK